MKTTTRESVTVNTVCYRCCSESDTHYCIHSVEFGITDLFTMSDAELFQHLMDHLLSFYFRKIGLIPECDHRPFVEKGALTQSLLEMIAKAMFVLGESLARAWETFTGALMNLVVPTPEKYVWHIITVCLVEERLTPLFYEKFVHVCALATTLGVVVYLATQKEFYKLTPRILTVFFENILIHGFKTHGGWNKLEKDLASQDYVHISGDWADYIGHGVEDLTRQVISALDASSIRELKAPTKKLKRSTSMRKKATKSLSEIGAVGGRSLEIDEHLITSKRNETSHGNEEMDDIEAILSDIKNMFTELVSVTVPSSSDESAKRLANNLGPFFERLKSNLERVVSILNLMQNSENGNFASVKGI
ncbi:hypothetical protein NPIL_224901 [Nephila pilipes]|uniref:Uncharacterized protein n=1 Tax=Nephila pilipes TaxID=299642 RepID=A0A8X6PWW1_NEPPI|nr:hypothetical protein NPIL_224901 [Nephila pilipes]